MRNVLIAVGTRPNIIKITQFKKLAREYINLNVEIVHTGQHYDHKMSRIFFDQFDVEPDYALTLKSKGVVDQMTEMIAGMGHLINTVKPDVLLVPGDVNSTFAAAFAGHKLGVEVGHIESGLRSFDRSMPEEINRILTDEISDHFFVTELSGLKNLTKEGKAAKAVHFVGNTMIDTLVAFDIAIDQVNTIGQYHLTTNEYCLLTFHRPGNVDSVQNQQKLVDVISAISADKKCVFPIHPRTLKSFEESNLLGQLKALKNLILTEPLGYFEFQNLVKNAFAIVTDSGGIQEESTFRRVPCITLRPNTERPVTIDQGTNVLLPFDTQKILDTLNLIAENHYKSGIIPELWDGRSTERILRILSEL